MPLLAAIEFMILLLKYEFINNDTHHSFHLLYIFLVRYNPETISVVVPPIFQLRNDNPGSFCTGNHRQRGDCTIE